MAAKKTKKTKVKTAKPTKKVAKSRQRKRAPKPKRNVVAKEERIKIKATPLFTKEKEARAMNIDDLRKKLYDTVLPVQPELMNKPKVTMGPPVIKLTGEAAAKPRGSEAHDKFKSELDKLKRLLQDSIDQVKVSNQSAIMDESEGGQVVSRLVNRGLITNLEAGSQLNQTRFWKDALISSLNQFLRNAPAGATNSELVKEVTEKFGLIWDPPDGRFGGSFRRLPILITKEQAKRLDSMILKSMLQHPSKREQLRFAKNLHLSPKEVAAQEEPRVKSRLEELASGGIRAESDDKWFENFKPGPTKVTEEKQPEKPQTLSSKLEDLEEQYADKVKNYLRARREMTTLKRALKQAYDQAAESNPQEQLKDTKPEDKSEDTVFQHSIQENLDDMFGSLFEGRKF